MQRVSSAPRSSLVGVPGRSSPQSNPVLMSSHQREEQGMGGSASAPLSTACAVLLLPMLGSFIQISFQPLGGCSKFQNSNAFSSLLLKIHWQSSRCRTEGQCLFCSEQKHPYLLQSRPWHCRARKIRVMPTFPEYLFLIQFLSSPIVSSNKPVTSQDRFLTVGTQFITGDTEICFARHRKAVNNCGVLHRDWSVLSPKEVSRISREQHLVHSPQNLYPCALMEEQHIRRASFTLQRDVITYILSRVLLEAEHLLVLSTPRVRVCPAWQAMDMTLLNHLL